MNSGEESTQSKENQAQPEQQQRPERRWKKEKGRKQFPPRRQKPSYSKENRATVAASPVIREAIDQIRKIRADLESVLRQMEEVSKILENAEKENLASEAEIETLRESLRTLRRGG